MYTCKQCNITLRGALKCCPLCQGELSGTPEKNTFPTLEPEYPFLQKLIRIGLFITLIAAAGCIGINLARPQDGWWFLFVLAGSGCFWFSVFMAIQKWNNIPKNIIWQVGILSALALLWDWETGYHGWALNYVFPFLCTGAMVSTCLLAYFLKLHAEEYIFYLILDGILGLIPLFLLLFHKVQILYPSALCVSVSIILFGGLFLFRRELFFSEIQRRTHL